MGTGYLAISKSSLTSFSLSPLYLEVRVEEETLKNVVPHSVATAYHRKRKPDWEFNLYKKKALICLILL